MFNYLLASEEELFGHDRVCLEIKLRIHSENEYNHVFVLEEEYQRVCLKYWYRTSTERKRKKFGIDEQELCVYN